MTIDDVLRKILAPTGVRTDGLTTMQLAETLAERVEQLRQERSDAIERSADLDEKLCDLRFESQTREKEVRRALNNALHESERSKDAPLPILVARLVQQLKG